MNEKPDQIRKAQKKVLITFIGAFNDSLSGAFIYLFVLRTNECL